MRVFAVVFALLVPALHASAQDRYPSRIVQIVVPYTPGTGADILSRALGPRLAERWKAAVVTENRAGASGNIGAEFVAKASPDGYILLCTATAFGTNPALNRRLPFDPVASFAPVIQIATSAMAVVVSPQLNANSVREFIDTARAQPGKLHYSSPGNGTPQHLAMELLKLDTRIELVHVPYKGSGGALADLVGGHVQAMITALQTVGPYIHGGKLRMLAVLGGERSAAFPDVPTIREVGYPDLEVETWYGLLAPAGTPPAVIARINTDLNSILRQPELRELLAKQGLSAAGGTPDRMAQTLKSELARWTRVVDAAHIRAD